MVTRMNREKTYRDCTVAGASPLGLLVALFDRLAGDLRRAAEAIRQKEIEGRCRELNHALVILAQLDSWVDFENGDTSARELAAFYAYLRSAILQASSQQSAAVLEKAIDSIVNVRIKWQELDAHGSHSSLQSHAVIASASASYGERASLSLSA